MRQLGETLHHFSLTRFLQPLPCVGISKVMLTWLSLSSSSPSSSPARSHRKTRNVSPSSQIVLTVASARLKGMKVIPGGRGYGQHHPDPCAQHPGREWGQRRGPGGGGGRGEVEHPRGVQHSPQEQGGCQEVDQTQGEHHLVKHRDTQAVTRIVLLLVLVIESLLKLG